MTNAESPVEAASGSPLPWSQFAEFGIAGAVIIVLFYYLFSLLKSHREEREKTQEQWQTERTEWRGEIRDLHKDQGERTEGLTKVINELTLAVKSRSYDAEEK